MKTLALVLFIGLFSISMGVGQTNKVNPPSPTNATNQPSASPLPTDFSVGRTNVVAKASERKIQYSGAVVKARRSGKPLQMINPFAPAEYGDGSDSVATTRPPGVPLASPYSGSSFSQGLGGTGREAP